MHGPHAAAENVATSANERELFRSFASGAGFKAVQHFFFEWSGRAGSRCFNRHLLIHNLAGNPGASPNSQMKGPIAVVDKLGPSIRPSFNLVVTHQSSLSLRNRGTRGEQHLGICGTSPQPTMLPSQIFYGCSVRWTKQTQRSNVPGYHVFVSTSV